MQKNKNIKSGNIFEVKENKNRKSEIFEILKENDKIIIEKIISYGQKTPDEEWLSEINDEWVILLQGKSEILYENNLSCIMKAGDYIFIPSGTKHKVTYTSEKPPCIWLAVHGNLK